MSFRIVIVVEAFALLACAGAQRRTDAMHAREVRREMGERMAEAGDWAGARQVAEGLTREDPRDAAARALRGRALRHQGLTDEAEADLRQALDLDPRNPRTHSELALLYEGAGRGDEALEHHRRARELAPDDPRWLNNLAFALLTRGKPREAVPLFQEALRSAPDDARLRNNLGFSLAAAGDYAGAARQFALGGTAAQARENLGFAYERGGNLSQAYALYLEAWKLAPSERTVKSLVAVARKLGKPVPPEVVVPQPDVGNGGT